MIRTRKLFCGELAPSNDRKYRMAWSVSICFFLQVNLALPNSFSLRLEAETNRGSVQ